MFGISGFELVIVLLLALILLGPERLPDAAKTFGKAMRQVRQATDDLKGKIEDEIYADERKVRPALVPPVPAAPVPGPAGPPPVATADNVPGLEAALAESPAAAPAPLAAPDPAPPAPQAARAAAPTVAGPNA
jgi:sec-independent protein translocase protein TatB